MAVVVFALLIGGQCLADNPVAVPTFECVSLYWKLEGAGAQTPCTVVYQEQLGLGQWGDSQPGHDLHFDYRTDEDNYTYYGPEERQLEYRGSVVGLKSNTYYKFTLTAGANVAYAYARTWSEDFPIKETRYVYDRTTPLLIGDGDGGNAQEGYVLYTFNPMIGSATIDVSGTADRSDRYSCGIAIQDSFVIIRGIDVVGGSHCIRMNSNWNAHNPPLTNAPITNVVIEECDLSNWGGPRYPGTLFQNCDHERAAIWLESYYHANPTYTETISIEDIVIQRNTIHNPYCDTNCWKEEHPNPPVEDDSYHPFGPVGIHIENSGGGIVIRFNEIFSDNGNYFCDGICGCDNFSYYGSPGCDSDIYQNWIANCWDDGIEAEGGGQNVRIWGNFLDHNLVMVACKSTSIGPLYIWRNVTGTSQKAPTDLWETELGLDKHENAGPFLKSGRPGDPAESGFYGDGRVYLYHNTVLQFSESPDDTTGCKKCISSAESGSPMSGFVSGTFNLVARNNILQTREHIHSSIYLVHALTNPEPRPYNDLDYDFCNGRVDCVSNSPYCAYIETNGYWDNATTDYVPNYSASNYITPRTEGQFHIAKWTYPPAPQLPYISIGIDDAELIANFNTGNPDRGAHEYPDSPMQFGIAATSPNQPAATPQAVTLVLRNGENGYTGHEDSYVSSMPGYVNSNYGTSPNSYIRNPYTITYNTRYQALEKFDVSAIPSGATITSATFEVVLRSNPSGSSTTHVHKLLHTWTESSVTWNKYDGVNTWDLRSSSVTVATPAASYQDPASPVAGDVMSYDITSLVQEWVDGTADDDWGFLIDEEGNKHHEVHSSEATTIAYRPCLTITYIPPQSSGKRLDVPTESNLLTESGLAVSRQDFSRFTGQSPLLANPGAMIEFRIGSDDVGEQGRVRATLELFDLNGRRVALLKDGEMTPGDYAVSWNRASSGGASASSGIYFARLTVGKTVAKKRVTVLR